MANFTRVDASGNVVVTSGNGAGSAADPFVPFVHTNTDYATVNATNQCPVTPAAHVGTSTARIVLSNSTSAGTNLSWAIPAAINQVKLRIVEATLTINNNNATLPNGVELWVFSESVGNQNDGAAFALTPAEMLKRVAVITFSSIVIGNVSSTVGTGCVGRVVAVGELVTMTSSSTTLYGILALTSTYTPGASELWTIGLQLSD